MAKTLTFVQKLNMSIAILTNHKDPNAWKKVLQEKLPKVDINIVGTTQAALNAEFLLCWKPQKDQLKNFSNLRVIQSLGAGVDHIFDTNKITAAVKVVRIVDPNLMVDMWEYTLAATMNYLKDFPKYAQQAQIQSWEQHPYKTIPSTTVSIMGLGKIGGYVAEQFAKLGFKVQGWSNSIKTIKGVKAFAGITKLPEFLENTDVLINILPLTPTTKDILNRTFSRKGFNSLGGKWTIIRCYLRCFSRRTIAQKSSFLDTSKNCGNAAYCQLDECTKCR